MSTRKGFTLIELLIVVAIIAILAAIAVPNFLEAQVRSKVSRALADMRTLATALEAYCVDVNKYPPDIDHTALHYYYISYLVTTPIAYLSTAYSLYDPFRYGKTSLPPEYWRYRYVSYDQRQEEEPTSTIFFPGGPERYGRWKLSSCGPDGIADVPQPIYDIRRFGGAWPPIIYDATNGTASWGDIIRSQKDSVVSNPK